VDDEDSWDEDSDFSDGDSDWDSDESNQEPGEPVVTGPAQQATAAAALPGEEIYTNSNEVWVENIPDHEWQPRGDAGSEEPAPSEDNVYANSDMHWEANVPPSEANPSTERARGPAVPAKSNRAPRKTQSAMRSPKGHGGRNREASDLNLLEQPSTNLPPSKQVPFVATAAAAGPTEPVSRKVQRDLPPVPQPTTAEQQQEAKPRSEGVAAAIRAAERVRSDSNASNASNASAGSGRDTANSGRATASRDAIVHMYQDIDEKNARPSAALRAQAAEAAHQRALQLEKASGIYDHVPTYAQAPMRVPAGVPTAMLHLHRDSRSDTHISATELACDAGHGPATASVGAAGDMRPLAERMQAMKAQLQLATSAPRRGTQAPAPGPPLPPRMFEGSYAVKGEKKKREMENIGGKGGEGEEGERQKGSRARYVWP
jgi:hypothetical protein